MSFKIKFKSILNQITLTDVNAFAFSGGEVHTRLDLSDVNCLNVEYINIEAKLKSSNNIMELLMITDTLKRNFNHTPINLIMPYLPYARQDKISADGESISLKVFADLINSQNYYTVTSFDVHSDVAHSLFNNFKNMEQHDIIIQSVVGDWLEKGNVTLVSPDFGASKKIYKLASHYNLEVVQANKARDSKGQIIKTEVYKDDFEGKDVLIVDDICDGGRTFQELVKVIQERNVGKISLYITHGIFSKGIQCLYDSGIDEIITTESFLDNFDFVDDERLIVIPF